MALDFSLLNEETPLLNTEVSPATGLDFSFLEESPTHLQGTAGVKQDISSYAKYMQGSYHPEFDPRYNEILRATRQSGVEQFGHMLLQSGAEVVGGTLEGLGHIETGLRELAGIENDWSNWLVDIGTGIKTWSREAAPIYQHPDDIGKFRPNRWSWWMTNAPSMASTLSLMIPASGITKGAALLGEGLGIAGKMGKGAKFAATVLGQATASRLMENGMEAAGLFEEVYSDNLRLGLPEEEAKKNASIAASDSWNKNWAMLAQDVVQYAILNKSFGKASKELTPGVAEAAGVTIPRLSKTKALAFDAFQEGGEEAFQYHVGKQAAYLAKRQLDPDYEKPSLQDYVQDGEFWTSFVMGALGSTVFQTAGRAINDRILKIKGVPTEEDRRIQNVNSWGPALSKHLTDLESAVETGDESNIIRTRSHSVANMAAKASEVGNYDLLIDQLNSIAQGEFTQEDLQRLNLTEEQANNLKEEIPNLINVAEEVKNRFEFYTRKKGYDPDIAAQTAVFEQRKKSLNDHLQVLEDRTPELEAKIPGFKSMTPQRQKIERLRFEKNSLLKAEKKIRKQLNTDKELTDQEKKALEYTHNIIKEKMQSKTEEIAEERKNYTQEDKLADKGIELNGTDFNNYQLNEDGKELTKADIAEMDNMLKFTEALQKKRDKNETVPRHNEPDMTDPNAAAKVENKSSLHQEDPTANEKDTMGEAAPSEQSLGDLFGVSTGIREEEPNLGGLFVAEGQPVITEAEPDPVAQTNSTVQETSSEDIEAKKADIERRREEELDSEDKIFLHGSKTKVTKFDKTKRGSNAGRNIKEGDDTEHGVFLTDDLETAEMYGELAVDEGKGEVTKVKVNLKADEIYNVDFEEKAHSREKTNKAIKEAKEKGYKAVAFNNIFDGGELSTSLLVFDENDLEVVENGNVTPYNKINAKYDAELAALEETITDKTIQQSSKKTEGQETTDEAQSDVIVPGEFGDETFGITYIKDESPMLTEYLSKGTSDLSEAYIDFSIDTESDFFLKRMEEIGVNPIEVIRAINNKNWGFFALKNEEKFNNLLDVIPIVGELTDKGKKIPDSVYLYESKTTPKGKTYSDSDKRKIKEKNRSLRAKMLKSLMFNGNARIDQVYKTGGTVNNTGNNKNLITAFNESSPNNFTFAYSKLETQGISSIKDEYGKIILADPESVGNVYLITNKTFDGKPYPIKLNPNKLSREHAEIVFEAFRQALTSKAGFGVEYKGPNVSSGLSTGRVLNDLVYNGYENTYQDPNSDKYRSELLNKQLYRAAPTGVQSTVLVYGNNNTIDMNSPREIEQKKEAFIEHAINNFNYSFEFDGLRDQSPNDYNIGDMVVKKGQTNKERLVNNDFILTDVELTNRGYAFQEPNIQIKYSSSTETIKTDDTETKAEDKEQKKAEEDTQSELDRIRRDAMGFSRPYREKKYIKADLQKEIKWIEKKLGRRLSPQVTKDIIKVATSTGTEYAMGRVRNASITLYEGMETGTGYHEAYHIVSLYLLTPEERQYIYNKAEEEYPELAKKLKEFDRQNAKIKQGPFQKVSKEDDLIKQKRDSIIEEFLAERFREYVLSQETRRLQTFINRILKLFKRLYNFVRGMHPRHNEVSEMDLKGLFKAINENQFKKSPILPENIEQFSGYDYLKTVGPYTTSQVKKIVDALMYQLFSLNNVEKTADIGRLDPLVVKAWVQKLYENFDNVQNKSDETVRLSNLWKDVYTYFDDFMDIVNDELLFLGINKQNRTIESNDGTVLQENKDNDPDSDNPETLVHDNKASYEINSRDNVRTNIKLFIATLPSSDEDAYTGLYKFVNFEESWNKLAGLLHGSTGVNDMISKLTELEGEDTYFSVLLNGTKNRIGLKTASENFKTQFYTALDKYKNNFVNILADNNYKFVSAETSKASRELVNTWGINLVDDTDLFLEPDERPNKDLIRELQGKYRAAFNQIKQDRKNKVNQENVEKYLDNAADILNEIGITVTSEELREMMNSFEGVDDITNVRSLYSDVIGNIFGEGESLLTQISKDRVGNKDLKDLNKSVIFQYERAIRDLATNIIDNTKGHTTSTIVGAHHNSYWIYSQSNFLTDFFSKNINDDKYVAGLLNSIGHNNSYFLKQIVNEGKKPELLTYASLVKNNESKENQELLPKEDYLLKMHSIFQDIMPLPTISDKKTYYFYKGLRRLDMTRMAQDPETGEFKVPPAVVEVFKGYLQDEIDFIAKVKKDVDKGIVDGKFSNLVKNVHWQGYVEKKHIDEAKKSNKTINGKEPSEAFIGQPLLKIGDNYKGNGTRYHLFSGFNNPANKLDFDKVEYILDNIIKKEILAAIDNGIIEGSTTVDEEGLITIKRLKNKEINKDYIKKYEAGTATGKSYMAIADYAINYMVAAIEATNMFTSDLAFYKFDDKVNKSVSEDWTKRMAELTAPGDPIRIDFDTDQYGVGESILGDTYKVATLKSDILNSAGLYKDLVEKFKKFHKEAFESTDAEAKKYAEDRLHGYTEVDVTDAQVYLSPQMYKEISIRMGEWNDQKDQAYNILMGNKEVSREERLQATEVIMQPLKLVHYGNYFRNGLSVPVYDKMSLAVLLPDMIEGTHLEPLYDKMTAPNGPGMIKFDSAVKAGNYPAIDYFNEDGTVNQSGLNSIDIYEQNFKFLRKQVVTDPHTTETRLLGTQVRKVSFSNLRKHKSVYKIRGSKRTFTGQELASMLSKTYAGLSNKGVEKVIELLGIDENRNIDKKKLLTILREQGKKSGLSYSIIDALDPEKVDEKGNMEYNLDVFPERKLIESNLSNIVTKKTVDLSTAGDAFIQMSNFGLKKIEEDSDLKLIDDKGRTEIRVSVGLFKDVIPNYDNLTFEEKKEFLKSEFDGIGYRIPTQGLGSIISFVVKDFLPENTGNVIVLPKEFTTLTGSDFDVDKLFIARYSYYYEGRRPIKYSFVDGDNGTDIVNSEEKLKQLWIQNYRDQIILRERLRERLAKDENENTVYNNLSDIEKDLLDEIRGKQTKIEKLKDTIKRLDEEIPEEESFIEQYKGKDTNVYVLNHKKAIENRIIDLMNAVVTNEEHVVETRTPLDASTGKVKAIANEIDTLTGVKRNQFSLKTVMPSNQVAAKLNNSGGKTGIGPYALNNANHVLTQMFDVGIESKYKIGLAEGDGQLLFNGIFDIDGNFILNWMDALVSAHVDMAKDPYIYRLNVREETHGIVALLLRAGVGEQTFYFLKQPAISDNIEFLGDNNPTFQIDRIVKNYMSKAISMDENSDKQVGKEGLEKIRLKWSSPSNIFSNIITDEYVLSTDEQVNFRVGNTTYKTEVEETTEGRTAKYYKGNNEITSEEFNKSYTHKAKNDLKWVMSGSKNPTAAWYARQAGILESFGKLKKMSQDLASIVHFSRIDNKVFGTSFVEQTLFNNQLSKVMLNPKLVNFDKMLSNSFLWEMYNNSVGLMKDIYSNISITTTKAYVDIIENILKDLTGSRGLAYTKQQDKARLASRDLFGAIANEYYYSVSGRSFNQESVKGLFYGNTSIGSVLHNFKRKHPELVEDNLLLSHLVPYFNTKDNVWFIKMRNHDKNDRWITDRLVQSWEDMLTSSNEELANLAEELTDYAFFSTGFSKTMNSIYNYIPMSFYKQKSKFTDQTVSYNDFIRDKLKIFSKGHLENEYSYSLLRDVVLHNIDMLPDTKLKRFKFYRANTSLVEVEGGVDYGMNELGQIVGARFVKTEINNKEYILEYAGFISDGTEAKSPKLVYRIVDKKGSYQSGHYIKEYGPNEVSFIQENSNYAYHTDESEIVEKMSTLNPKFQYVIPGARLDYKRISDEYIEDVRVDETDKVSDEVTLPTEPAPTPEDIEDEPSLGDLFGAPEMTIDEKLKEVNSLIQLYPDLENRRDELENAARNSSETEFKNVVEQMKGCNNG